MEDGENGEKTKMKKKWSLTGRKMIRKSLKEKRHGENKNWSRKKTANNLKYKWKKN